ncbi:MAG: SpoIIE family protein phosphatase [Acidobacteria bacterium]|nr:SpoIIE family protein phosphatase [Acidobacteriota bacterium]
MQVSSALKAAGESHPGLKRPINEDRCHFDAGRGIFVVIDGVGGQAAGEKAADTALGIVRSRLERETGTIEDRVREAIALANNEIHRLASLRPEWRGMACVLTIAVISNGDVVVGHVGDTRLYKLRGGGLTKLTRDHSPVGEREDSGELPERDAMAHPRRNEVYRDVGSERHDPDDPQFIDIFRVPFEPDAALLLCSDGLTDLVTATAIVDIVRIFAGHPFEVVRGLIDAANDAGGKDNVTVVYVEGPRFAQGEDTRDLRPRRPPLDDDAIVAAAPRESHRWRTAALIALLVAVAATAAYLQWDRLRLPDVLRTRLTSPSRITVRSGQSIAAALQAAPPGSEVVVDPGEYRERVRLKDGVHLLSRVAGGASIRLPGDASETDAAVVGAEISSAALSGFRIVGDAATPLGTGVMIRNASVELSDIEITGAHTAAIEYATGGSGSLTGTYLHDNPGAAAIIRGGATPRLARNVFVRNASSQRAPGTLLVEPGARPVIVGNTFEGVRPDSLALPPSIDINRDNWFVNAPERPAAPGRAPQRGPGRGR